MASSDDPIVRFFKLTQRGRMPMRSDRSAIGMLPARAVRYCEAVCSATAYGWWLFPPLDMELVWDGTGIFWRCDGFADWMPLQPSAQMPNYVDEFDAAAPEDLKGCSPPFMTALPEPGLLQFWTGIFAQTAPDWHLLVRAPANMPQIAGIVPFEGIVETDRWFGPVFSNLRFTRTHMPVKLRSDYPLLQVQPIPRHAYSADTLERMEIVPGPRSLTPEEWESYRKGMVEPSTRPDRPFGAYAIETRKKRHRCHEQQAAAAE